MKAIPWWSCSHSGINIKAHSYCWSQPIALPFRLTGKVNLTGYFTPVIDLSVLLRHGCSLKTYLWLTWWVCTHKQFHGLVLLLTVVRVQVFHQWQIRSNGLDVGDKIHAEWFESYSTAPSFSAAEIARSARTWLWYYTLNRTNLFTLEGPADPPMHLSFHFRTGTKVQILPISSMAMKTEYWTLWRGCIFMALK